MRAFTSARILVVTASLTDLSGGPDTFRRDLPLDGDADVLLPSGAVVAATTSNATIDVEGNCDGPGRVDVALNEDDIFVDDVLDRQFAVCDAGRFALRLVLFCEALPWTTLEGPRGSSGEERAEIYVEDRRGEQQIPIPAGERFWGFTCGGSEVVVREPPRGSPARGGDRSRPPIHAK